MKQRSKSKDKTKKTKINCQSTAISENTNSQLIVSIHDSRFIENEQNVINENERLHNNDLLKTLQNLDQNFKALTNKDYCRSGKYKSVFEKYEIKNYEKDAESWSVEEAKEFVKEIVDDCSKKDHLLKQINAGGCTEDEIIQLIWLFFKTGNVKESDSLIALLKSNKKLTFKIFEFWFRKRHCFIDYWEREELIRRHINEFPDDIDFYKFMCNCCKRCFEYDSLAFVLSTIPTRFKTDIVFLRYYGRLVIRAGFYSDGIKIFERILEHDDRKEVDYLLCAENYLGNKDSLSFTRTLSAGRHHFPHNAEILYRLALYYYGIKEYSGAKHYLKQLSDIKVDNKRLWKEIFNLRKNVNSYYEELERREKEE